MIASGYEWLCEECEKEQHEIAIPSDDLTCQDCGANYILGETDHAYL
jgi:ribosomal protein S27E